MKKITAGITAHVDSGKTTLSEALLYTCGNIRKLGRDRIAALDPETLQYRKDIFIILRGSLPGLFYSCNALLMPCNGNSLNITNAAASAGNTVFHQIFDKVGGEAKLVIQI